MEEQMSRIVAMEIDIAKCQTDMHLKITNINKKLEEQDKLRNHMNDKLDAIANQSRQNYAKFDLHTKEEMDKYEQIKLAIEKMTATIERIGHQTKENKAFRDSEIHNRELEARVAKELHDLEAPKRELIHKVKMTAASVITVATLAVAWEVAIFVIDLSRKVNG